MSIRRLFPRTPSVSLLPQSRVCQCGARMSVKKTRRRDVVTMEVSRLSTQETIVECTRCGLQRGSEELARFVPPRSRYSYGVIVYVGLALFERCQSELAVQQELRARNIHIARSEVGYLGRKFIAYLATAHRESLEPIKRYLASQGGYILHLDATCEGESPMLMSGLTR